MDFTGIKEKIEKILNAYKKEADIIFNNSNMELKKMNNIYTEEHLKLKNANYD